MKRSVLFVIDVMSVGGGAQKVLIEMLSILQDKGYTVKLLALKKTDTSFESDSLEVEYLLESEQEKILPNLFVLLEKIRIQAQHYDLLVSFMDYIVCYCVALAAKMTVKPYYAFVRCEPSFVAQTFPQPSVNQELYSLCLKGAQKVICNSKSSYEDVIENFGVDSHKVYLLYNPVTAYPSCHLQESEIQEWDIKDQHGLPIKKKDEIFCLMIGRLHPIKNHPVVIKAFSGMQDQNIKLFILGEGESKEELLHISKDLNNVTFLGYTSYVKDYLKVADIVIHASFSEGFPNVLLEAASCSKPLVLSDIKPHQEIFHGKALFFDPLDSCALQEQIKHLALNIDLRNKLGMQAFEAVSDIGKNFSQNLCDLFDE